MKNIYSFIFLFIVSNGLLAQEKFSGNLNTGLLFPFTDYTETSYPGHKPNLAISTGIGYQFNKYLKLRGDILYGTLNGNNNINFYETSIYDGQLALEFNAMKLFNDRSNYKINVLGGTGLIAYYSRLYSIATGNLVAASPADPEKILSPNAYISGGLNVGVPITKKLDVNAGFTLKYLIDAPYLDATQSGDATDHFGFLNVGLVYYLKSDKDKNKIEMDKRKYRMLVNRMDSLENASSGVSPEKLARMEMESQEKDLLINSMREELDSLRANVVEVKTDRPGQQTDLPDRVAILNSVQYRIIVASLPTRAMAQRWIDRSQLDKSEMITAYIEDINTYRVIYKSFDTLAAAKKELQQVKSLVSDAWIIKF